MRIEFDGLCEPNVRYWVTNGSRHSTPRELPHAILAAIKLVRLDGREVHIMQHDRTTSALRGRVIPENGR